MTRETIQQDDTPAELGLHGLVDAVKRSSGKRGKYRVMSNAQPDPWMLEEGRPHLEACRLSELVVLKVIRRGIKKG